MNAVAVIVVLAALLALVALSVRHHHAGRYRLRIHPPAWRFLHRRARQASMCRAQEVARAIIEDRPDPVAHLAAGVILESGEDAWGRVEARLAVRSGRAGWTVSTRMSWLDHGKIEWLITNRRLVGRLPASGEVVSLWDSGLAGADIDLKHDRIVLNGTNGWTGTLTGPAVTPIAVAVVAMCHGIEALRVHPALQHIRRAGPRQPPPLANPEPSKTTEPRSSSC